MGTCYFQQFCHTSSKCSHFLHEGSFQSYRPTIKISLLQLKYQTIYYGFLVEIFAEKYSSSPLEALECPDEAQKLNEKAFVQFQACRSRASIFEKWLYQPIREMVGELWPSKVGLPKISKIICQRCIWLALYVLLGSIGSRY